MNSQGVTFKKLADDSEKDSIVNEDGKTNNQRIKKLQKILKLKRKSTVDHFKFISNQLLVPGVTKSQQNNDSNAAITVSSQTDMLSALGVRNEIRRESKRMQSFILCSHTLNKNDGSRRPSIYSVGKILILEPVSIPVGHLSVRKVPRH
jgi:hypothetical protein